MFPKSDKFTTSKRTGLEKSPPTHLTLKNRIPDETIGMYVLGSLRKRFKTF
jgi:hypothetical protein